MRSTDSPVPSGARRRARRRLTAGVLATTVILAACGGSDSGSGADSGEPLPEVESTETGDEAASAPAPTAAGAGYVDLVGPDVVAAAEIETNLLPNVVVDDLTNGRKVNFRNLVPQDKPVLLWMYAPH